MINTYDILETIRMIQDECLDIRTTTMGISLLDCADTDIDKLAPRCMTKFALRRRSWSRPARTLSGNTVFLLSTSESA